MSWAREKFPNKAIIYFAGNHEFYGQHWDAHLEHLRLKAIIYDINFLENDAVTIEGIRFLGATLWTDFEFFGKSRRPQIMRLAETGMSDFRMIEADPLQVKLEGLAVAVVATDQIENRSITKLSPTHTVLRHRESLTWLQEQLTNREQGDPETTVVVTHHCPSKRSTLEKWGHDPLTATFCSKLEHQLLTQTKLWIHGHTHDSYDYKLGSSKRSVRVVCNPRGYPMGSLNNDFENRDFNPALLVEIGC